MISRFSRRQALGRSGAVTLAVSSGPLMLAWPVRGRMAYDLVDIGEVQRDLYSRTRFLVPNDIDDAGNVLGNCQITDQVDAPYCFSDGSRTWLETGDHGARAMCFIDRRRIAGRDFTGWGDDGLPTGAAVRWVDGRKLPLPLPKGLPDRVVNANVATAHPDGRVAGSLTLANGRRVPVLWTNQQPEVLPMLDGFMVCEPKTILDTGMIGGTASDALGFDYPIYWQQGSVYLLLTTMVNGYVRHHSGAGLTALLGSIHTGQRYEAGIWRDGWFRLLPALPGDFHESWVESMNQDDVACGTIARSSRRDAWTAVLWKGEEVVELSSLLDLDDNIHVIRATAINNAGQIAAAAIWTDGTLHAVLLNPR